MPTVLITGASRGIGLEFARQYAAGGWCVIATCRDPQNADKLQKLAQQNPSVQIETLDVADQKSIESLASKLNNVAIDVLINNAGITAQGKGLIGWDSATGDYTGTLNPEAWRNVLNVNTVGPIMTTLAFLPHVKRGTDRKIIMVSSRCGSVGAAPFPEYISYNASKAGLNIGMRNLATLLKPQAIAFMSLHPGNVQTDMGGPNAEITAEASVTGMRSIIANLTLEQSGSFLGYDGTVWPF